MEGVLESSMSLGEKFRMPGLRAFGSMKRHIQLEILAGRGWLQ
jgi:hypothetical protein